MRKGFRNIKMMNFLTGSIIILTNLIFFIPGTIKIINELGDTWGFGIMLLPITIIGNLFFMVSLFSFSPRLNRTKALLFFNISGAIGCLFWLWFFYHTSN